MDVFLVISELKPTFAYRDTPDISLGVFRIFSEIILHNTMDMTFIKAAMNSCFLLKTNLVKLIFRDVLWNIEQPVEQCLKYQVK